MQSKSKIQERIYLLLTELFPNARIKKEYKIKYKRRTLFVDFYIPFLNLVIEVDGRQHNKFNNFYHKSFFQFYESYRRDRLKEDWAIENKICLIRINENEARKITKEELLRRIINAKQEDREN